MSQKCKEMTQQFRGTPTVTWDSKIMVNISSIPEGTTNTSIAQKPNYKAYAAPAVRHAKGKKEKPAKMQQTHRNHIVHI